jgi:hypothetical protein
MWAIREAKKPLAPVLEPGVTTGVEDKEHPGPSGPRIRCPLCGWMPAKHDVWHVLVAIYGTHSIRGLSGVPQTVVFYTMPFVRQMVGPL